MIDKEKIENLVNNIIKNGAGHKVRRIESAMQDEPDVLVNDFVFTVDAEPFIKELLGHIVGCKHLSKVFNNNLYNLGMIYVNVVPGKLVEWLVIHSQVDGTKPTIDYLDEFLEQNYTPAMQVVSVSGITVSEEICISSNIKLVPMKSLMHSYQRNVSAPKKLNDLPGSVGSYMADEKFPTCALIKEVKLDTVVTEKTKESKNNAIEDFTELEEMCDFFTLHKDATALPFNKWIDIDERVPCSKGQLKGMKGGIIEIHHKKEIQISQNDWDSLRPIYEKYHSLPAKEKIIIRSALSRIKKARLRHALVDTAIDLGVGLEALFLEQNEDSKIAYKFRLRATHLLAITKEDKDKINSLFKSLYKIRSEAVHNGELKSTYKVAGSGNVETSAIIKEGIEKGLESIVAIINNGRYPDWKKEIKD